MFGRRSRPSAAPRHAAVMPDVGTVAVPDYASAARLDALDARTTRQLAGHSGTVIGYDRGDAMNSFTAVLQGVPDPARALARIGTLSDATRTSMPPEVADSAVSPQLDAFQRITWARG